MDKDKREGPGSRYTVTQAGLAGIVGAGLLVMGGLAVTSLPGERAKPVSLPGQTDAEAMPAVLTQQTGGAGIAASEDGGVDFIVRFEKLPELEACQAAWRNDPEAARAMFRDWASAYPELAGLRLKKASYSGELVLTWQGGGSDPTRADIMAARDRIISLPIVRYADPDFTARVEGP